jgi:hypothetical protein
LLGCEPKFVWKSEILIRLLVMLAPEPPKVVEEFDELSKSQEFVGANVILSEEDFQTLLVLS